MKYTYKILDQVYNWMITKQKNIEIRPFNEKADIIKIGDYITFYNKDNETEFVKTKVIDKKIYNSIEEILNPLGSPSALALSPLFHASNLDW